MEPSGHVVLYALYRHLRAGKEAQPQTLNKDGVRVGTILAGAQSEIFSFPICALEQVGCCRLASAYHRCELTALGFFTSKLSVRPSVRMWPSIWPTRVPDFHEIRYRSSLPEVAEPVSVLWQPSQWQRQKAANNFCLSLHISWLI